MKNLLRVSCLLLVLAATVHSVQARSPEETLLAYVEAVQKEGLAAAVRFIHSAELADFRAEIEPEIVKRIKNGRTRQQFMAFTDPYNQKQIRPFKDDADFVAVFIKWITTSGMVGVMTYDNATVTPLGCITEGDLRHVVARFAFAGTDRKGEVVSVTSMKMDGGQPMLLLLPELRNVAMLVRQGSTR